MDKLNNLNPWKVRTKDNQETAYDNALELYSDYQKIYYNQSMTLSDTKKESWVINIVLIIYFLKHKYSVCFQNEELTYKEE